LSTTKSGKNQDGVLCEHMKNKKGNIFAYFLACSILGESFKTINYTICNFDAD